MSNRNPFILFTTEFTMSYTQATLVANLWSKGISAVTGEYMEFFPTAYFTAIPSEGSKLDWLVSNKFDPRTKV